MNQIFGCVTVELSANIISTLLVTPGFIYNCSNSSDGMTGETEQSVHSPVKDYPTLRSLSLVVIGGPVLFWVVVVVLGVITPGYSTISDHISTLGAVNAPYALVQRANFFVLGGSILAFAYGLDRWAREGWRPWLGIVLIGVFGVGIIGAGVFSDDLANPTSMTAQLHQLVSSIAFLAALVGMPLTTWEFEQSERWPNYRYRFTSVGLAIILMASLVVFSVSLNTWWAGLGQRQYILLLTGWIVRHSVTLYHLTQHNQG